MTNLHGVIYAYLAAPRLGELVSRRTSASLPFAGRYRLIDFSLSSMMNAGVQDVGVIMQRDYQSLLDHLGSGKNWDLSRRQGGLRLLPPFGLSDSHTGTYEGNMEALSAVASYIEDIRQDYVVLARGDLAANIDLKAVAAQHLRTGADVTAVCTPRLPAGSHHRFLVDEEGWVEDFLYGRHGLGPGVASLEVYILSKQLLLELISWSISAHKVHFHRDVMSHLLERGARIGTYMHTEYAVHIVSVRDYFQANLDMLDTEKRAQLFPESRPVRTKERSDASTYYGDEAKVTNSLVADGCYVEGMLENTVLFRGVRVEKGAQLRNCIVMQDGIVGTGALLRNVIADKDVRFSPYVTLTGSERLPMVIPKESIL